MPSQSLPQLCSAGVCCLNSPSAEDSNDRSSGWNGNGGDRTAGTNAVSSPSSFPPSSSSRSAPACNFSLLASLNTSTPSSPAALAVSGHSPPLLCVASEPEIVVYDLTDFRTVASAAGRGSGSVKSVQFSTDGARVFTAHQDSRIRLWSTSLSAADRSRRLRLVATLPSPSDFLRHFAFPKNYVPIRRHKRTLWINHADAVSSLATHGDFLCSGSWDKTIKLWHVASSRLRCLESVPAHDDAVNAVAVARDGVVYTASADSLIKVWMRPPATPPPPGKSRKKKKKRRKIELVATLEKHSSAVNALALSPDGSVLYSGGCDGSIVAWEGGAGPMGATVVLRGHEKSVMCLATVDDLVVSGSTDRAVRIWRSAEGGQCCVAVLMGHRKGVRSVGACRLNRDSNRTNTVEYIVCGGSVEGEVRIWKVLINR